MDKLEEQAWRGSGQVTKQLRQTWKQVGRTHIRLKRTEKLTDLVGADMEKKMFIKKALLDNVKKKIKHIRVIKNIYHQA